MYAVSSTVANPYSHYSSNQWPGAVVRPSNAWATQTQTFVFNDRGVHELQHCSPESSGSRGGGSGWRYTSSSDVKLSTALTDVRYPVYEPTSNCVLFVKGHAVCSLDSNNVVDVVAGNMYTQQETVCSGDGYRGEARFSAITALAPDGKGSVYVAEAQRIRKVDILSGQVTTLTGSTPPTGSWTGLSCDDDADVLFATTASAICRIDVITLTTTAASAHVSDANGGECTTPMDTAAGELEAKVNLVAGDWQATGNTDGPGTKARFTRITAILAGVHQQLYILDHDKFRIMSASGYISTALPGLPTDHCSIAALPSGELALCTKYSSLRIIRGPQLGPSSPTSGGIKASHSAPRQRPSAALSKLHRTLLLCAAGADVNPATVNIHTRDGTVFVAHRSALVSHSQYFEKLLVPGGGFADSGAEDVKLPDADPAAFQWLLAYMYTGELYMPDELLRPAVLLADRLLMPQDCVGQLQKWLLAKVTPQSVLSDLVWAEQHSMTSLVPQLKLRLLRKRKSVVLGEEDLRQLIVHCPCLVADLIREPVAFRAIVSSLWRLGLYLTRAIYRAVVEVVRMLRQACPTGRVVRLP